MRSVALCVALSGGKQAESYLGKSLHRMNSGSFTRRLQALVPVSHLPAMQEPARGAFSDTSRSIAETCYIITMRVNGTRIHHFRWNRVVEMRNP